MIKTGFFRPLAMLGTILGGGFRTHMHQPPTADRAYRRSWPCGCNAVYHDERERSAEWFPCDSHYGWGVEH
jgi:hypothetical protein